MSIDPVSEIPESALDPGKVVKVLQPQILALSNAVIDQIAAGEIIERPAQLVKELVENSLDAGATQIDVEVFKGGRCLVIEDNGHGIPKSEVRKAFLRHSTSKLRSLEDLDSIRSFGFRGEALAALVSVAKVNIQTRFVREEEGSEIQFLPARIDQTDVNIVREGFIQRPPGTRLFIEDVFGHLPARLKFLKSEASELAQIKLVFKSFALVNSRVQFRLKVEGELVYFWGDEVRPLLRAQEVLGVSDELFTTQRQTTTSGSHLEIFFSSPHQVARVSKNIWIFVQGRWVFDKTIQAAVMEAYQGLLMHGEYPYVVVNLQVDPSRVDVNVHPTKSQVRFLDSKTVFREIYHVLRRSLEKSPWNKKDLSDQGREPEEVLLEPKETHAESFPSEFVGASRRHEESGKHGASSQTFERPRHISSSQMVKINEGTSNKAWQTSTETPSTESQSTLPSQEFDPFRKSHNQAKATSVFQKNQNNFYAETLDQGPWVASAQPGEASERAKYWSSLTVKAQIHGTYLVCESEKSLILVDQHAAHERIMYEKLKSQFERKKMETQLFLLPIHLDLSKEGMEILEQNHLELAAAGIEIETAGPNTVAILSAPPFIKEKALIEGVLSFVENSLSYGGSKSLETLWHEVFSRWACHSAVRAGETLDPEQMQNLLREMDQYPLSSFCPHGRPVSIEWSWAQVETQFGRRG